MRILALESSCDESAAAWLDIEDGKINRLEHVVATQAIHEKFGGVVPEIAAREHSATIPHILETLAKKVVNTRNGVDLGTEVDAIAVTQGPGLVTSLRVGIDTARSLAAAWDKPIVGVNHIEGHIYSNWLPGAGFANTAPDDKTMFPAIVLVVSGGHTETLLMKGHGDYELIGATRDDAAGENFDKSAKLLGLSYPGGPKLSALAESGNRKAVDFPRPMIHDTQGDFSFSGLKTAVRYFIRDNEEKLKSKEFRRDTAASIEGAIVDVLVTKTIRAAKEHGVNIIMLAGGVAANSHLRHELERRIIADGETVLYVRPELRFCTDNAAMIAMAGYYNMIEGRKDDWSNMGVHIGWELGRK